MQRECQVPGRNYCAPNGKIAALFVDIDGTCLKCEEYFEQAKRRFEFFMQLCGLDGAAILAQARKLELAYIGKHGFEREALGKSMCKAYRQACRENGVPVKRHILEICRDIGHSPYFREPELFANTAAVLNRAHHNFYIIAVSIGNREAQKYKVRMAGLDAIFDHIIITQQDNKSQLVGAAIEDLEIDPRYSAFIGNSVRSDGQCLKDTNFIHMPLESWSFDNAQLPRGTGFEVFDARDWREAEEMGINRLLLRRQVALEKEQKGRRQARPAKKQCKRQCKNRKPAPAKKPGSMRTPAPGKKAGSSGKRTGRR